MRLPPTASAHTIHPIKREALVGTWIPFNDPEDGMHVTIASGVNDPVSDTFSPTVNDLWVNCLLQTGPSVILFKECLDSKGHFLQYPIKCFQPTFVPLTLEHGMAVSEMSEL
ncbi:hypothetical protein IV203_032362 [Nitzschia inconspicua]|nr:hypothetical protein IV203_032362 [Nitzschia inconspicua]